MTFPSNNAKRLIVCDVEAEFELKPLSSSCQHWEGLFDWARAWALQLVAEVTEQRTEEQNKAEQCRRGLLI